MSTSVTVFGTASDGHMYKSTDLQFSNARDATSATGLDVSSDTMRVGLGYQVNGDKYRFYRLALYFDASSYSIPANATITGATISIYLVGNLTIISPGFDLILMKDFYETYPHATLESGDFDRTHYFGGGADSPTIYGGTSGHQRFEFNIVGKAIWINNTGTSKFVVMSSLDVGYNIPNYYMLADFYTEEKGTTFRPKLDLTYAIPCTVVTGAATGISSSGATGHGQVTDAEGETVDGYGVIWNNDGTDPVDFDSADNSEAGSDIDGGLNFTTAITGCNSGASYYYRVYATTDAGTSVGDAVQFTTSSVSVLTVITGVATDVEDTTATLNGNVTDDHGDTITERGFVYKKGSDPGTPADPTDADNYTEDGGTTGVYDSDITSLDDSSAYFVRSYVISDAPDVAYGGIVVFYTTGAETSLDIDGMDGDGTIYFAKTGACGETPQVLCCIHATSAASKSDIVFDANSLLSNWTSSTYPTCTLQRCYIYFETRWLDTEIIKSVTLKLYMEKAYYNSGGITYLGLDVMQDSDHVYPSDLGYPLFTPLMAIGDFDENHYSSVATVTSGTMGGLGGASADSINKVLEITIPTSSINFDGLTKFFIQASIESSADSSNGLQFRSADGDGGVGAVSATPTNGGSGYTTGNILTLTGGSNDATVTVGATAGVVTSVSLTTPGSDSYTVSTGNATSGGGGTGCTIEITQIRTGPVLTIDYLEQVDIVVPSVNMDGSWVTPESVIVNIGDEWVVPESIKANIGDSWVDPT